MLSVVLYLFVIAIMARTSDAKIAIFVFGDSTSLRTHQIGMTAVFNCSQRDRYVRKVEVDYKQFKDQVYPYICSGSRVSRIGFMSHWGVRETYYEDETYLNVLRVNGDSLNSINNIMLALKEFQSRSANDSRRMFIFSSNFWDAKYMLQSPYFSFEKHIDGYARNYSIVVRRLIASIDAGDSLVVQTAHLPITKWAAYVPILNMEINAFAIRHNLPVLRNDLYACNVSILPTDYLEDDKHQKPHISVVYAQEIQKLSLLLYP